MLDDVGKVASIRKLRRVLAVIAASKEEPEATSAGTEILADFLDGIFKLIPGVVAKSREADHPMAQWWGTARGVLALLKAKKPEEWVELEACVRELGIGELVDDLPDLPPGMADMLAPAIDPDDISAGELDDARQAIADAVAGVTVEDDEPTEDDISLWTRSAMQALAEQGIVVDEHQARTIVLRHSELIQLIGDADDAAAAGGAAA